MTGHLGSKSSIASDTLRLACPAHGACAEAHLRRGRPDTGTATCRSSFKQRVKTAVVRRPPAAPPPSTYIIASLRLSPNARWATTSRPRLSRPRRLIQVCDQQGKPPFGEPWLSLCPIDRGRVGDRCHGGAPRPSAASTKCATVRGTNIRWLETTVRTVRAQSQTALERLAKLVDPASSCVIVWSSVTNAGSYQGSDARW